MESLTFIADYAKLTEFGSWWLDLPPDASEELVAMEAITAACQLEQFVPGETIGSVLEMNSQERKKLIARRNETISLDSLDPARIAAKMAAN